MSGLVGNSRRHVLSCRGSCTYTKVSYNSWAYTFIHMYTIFQTLVHTNEHFVEIESFSVENIFRYEKRQLLKISISLVTRNPVFGVFDQGRHKAACAATEAS